MISRELVLAALDTHSRSFAVNEKVKDQCWEL